MTYIPNSTWFFTLNLAERQNLLKGHFSRAIDKGERVFKKS